MAIFAIITLNLFLRFFRLNVPPFVYLDEKNFFVPAAKSLLTQSTEPPYTIISFGKVLIASGIRLFGDNPWGWRAPSALFGILAAVIVYLFAKKLFESQTVGITAVILFTFETAWFVNSRVAMVEVFFATFVILAFYLLWLFIKDRRNYFLITSSVIFGLALATKWSALFPILSAIISISFVSKLDASKKITAVLALLITCLTVYFIALLPFIWQSGIDQFILKHKQIWHYQTLWLPQNFQKAAPYIPKFEYVKDTLQNPLLWLVDKPGTYLEEAQNGQVREILFIFKPVIFWPGLLLLLVSLVKGFKDSDLRLLLMPLVFASSYLPWFFSPRFSIPYYLLFGITALIINLAFYINILREKIPLVSYFYLFLVILFFILYYPLISFIPVSKDYLSLLTKLWQFPVP